MMCGGASSAEDAGKDVQELCELVRSELEEQSGCLFQEYVAVKVSKQVVAGTNYFVKVRVGAEEYVHVRIFKPLPGAGEPNVQGFQLGKTKDEEVAYFEA